MQLQLIQQLVDFALLLHFFLPLSLWVLYCMAAKKLTERLSIFCIFDIFAYKMLSAY